MPVTETEKILSKLCHNTFLKLWSFPNLYTDEGKTTNKGDGKEFCDLFVVFDNHLIFFSDKKIKYNTNKDREVAWNRWYKKAVIKSAKQIYGAESFLNRYPNRIYLDKKCTKKLPISLSGNKQYEVHRILVANGIVEPIREFYNDERGSLIIRSQKIEKDFNHLPFSIGQDGLNKGYVHVFDDFTIQLVLNELDTISDFVNYLQARKRLLEESKVFTTGEEELLANYLRNIDENGEHSFNLPFDEKKENTVFLDQGGWDSFISSHEYKNKKQADQISLRWDDIIIKLGDSIPHDAEEFNNVELVLRKMASESRFERRMLCEQLFNDFGNKAAQHEKLFRLAFPLNNKDRAYILLSLKNPFNLQYDEYRNVRSNLLRAYCRTSKLKLPQMKEVIALAVDAPNIEGNFTLDAAYFDFSEWTKEDDMKAQIEKKELNLLDVSATKSGRSSGKEYPEIPMYDNSGGKLSRQQRRKM
ncbi:MAG: hypothetical protein WDZ80_03600 [Candidatus Paceibacterota bacterium]